MIFHKSKKDILNGNIPEQILIFTIPVLGAYLLQQLYQFADSIVLGRFASVEAMAAVGGSATMVINIINNFVTGLASGAIIVVAQNYGRGNVEKVKLAVKSSMFICVVIGGLITIVSCLLARPILNLMNCPVETIKDSIIYMDMTFFGIIPYMIYNFGNNILRATGDTKKSLLFTMIIAVVKVVLDILLTGILQMGVWGVGISTVASYLICGIVILLILHLTPDCYHFEIKDFGFDIESTKAIFKVGVPVAVQSVLFAFSNLLIQKEINVFGTNTIAAFSAYNNVDNFYWNFSNAIGSAVITIAGQNYGNKNMKRVHDTVKYGLIICAIATTLIGSMNYFLGEFFISIFTTDSDVIAIGTDMIMLIAKYYMTYLFVEIISCTIKGCGDSFDSMIIAFLGICVVRVLYLIMCNFTEAIQIICCYPISWAITSLIYLSYYLIKKKYRLSNKQED